MKKYKEEFLIEAHKACDLHRKSILENEFCGCFYCKKVYKSIEIKEWTDDEETAICPKCGIDSVLSSQLPIDKREFLAAMNNYYF